METKQVKQPLSGEQRAEQIKAQHGPFIVTLIKRAERLAANPQMAPDNRRAAILRVASEFAEFITDQTVCKQGCSHCCYQAVGVSRYEAELIEKHTGQPRAATNEDFSFYVANDGWQAKYAGVPCSFLSEGRCTIYPVRPMACRLHHSLEHTSDHCRIGYEGTIGILNIYEIHNSFFNAKPFEGIADIREYFPSKATNQKGS